MLRRTQAVWPRYIAAALCVLASVAYVLREPSAPLGTAPVTLGALLNQVAAIEYIQGKGEHKGTQQHHQPRSTLAPRPRLAPNMPIGLPHVPAQPNAPPAPHHHEPHNHAAHCPFCFAAAFALQAASFVLLLPLAYPPAPARRAHPRTSAPRLGTHQARAPPLAAYPSPRLLVQVLI